MSLRPASLQHKEHRLTKNSDVRPEGSFTPPPNIVVEVLWTCGLLERTFVAAVLPPFRIVVPRSQLLPFLLAMVVNAQAAMRRRRLPAREKRSPLAPMCHDWETLRHRMRISKADYQNDKVAVPLVLL